MKWLQTISTLALASQLALSQGPSDRGQESGRDSGADRAEAPGPGVPVPPVLRPLEPPDNRFVTLPGVRVARPVQAQKPPVLTHPLVLPPHSPVALTVPALPVAPDVDLAQPAPQPFFPPDLIGAAGQPPPPAPAPTPVNDLAPPPLDPPVPAAPVAPPVPAPLTVPAIDTGFPAPNPPVPTAPPATPPPAPTPEIPAAPTQANPNLAADFQAESALFLQKQIGWWTLADARTLLGNPERQRPALDDNQAPNGQIYAFSDPSGRYQELELDFDAENGNLRTVFVYPYSMTWQECRRQFGANVSATQANKGRIFYSYVNRRLDVLVAPGGQVISLGLY